MDADSRSVPGMNILKANARYEEWLSRHLRLLAPDLALKHQAMRSAPFPFLRATFYRWAQVWPEICPEAAEGAAGTGGGRPAYRKLRNLAGYRRPPDLGHQRFRRSVAPALHQRPDPAGDERAAGARGLRRKIRHRRAAQGIRGRPRRRRKAVRAGRTPPRAAHDGHGAPARNRSCFGRSCTRCRKRRAQLRPAPGRPSSA